MLINLTNTAEAGFDFDSSEHPHRLFLQGKCDDTLTEVAESCGWGEELTARFAKTEKKSKKPRSLVDAID